jgi:lipopolysaccharide transport system ATP-binding protein
MEEELMSEELMLKVDNVYKKYRLGVIGGGTLTGDLQSWWAKVRHKEDPNSMIGAKTYSKNEEFYALNGISFEVKKGEALGIIGGNGAGKSTTLKLLSQVTAPTKGKIYLNGRIASMLEVGTGFHPELTGRENIYLNGAILGMTKAEIDAKVDEIIDFSECRQFIDTPVKRYSSGMYVKLAFSVAAHLDSEIMIMDEVLAVGDMAFQKKCIDKMVNISSGEGRTILYVSHNMNTIKRLCNRCIYLEKGRVVFEGDVDDAIAYYMKNNTQSFDTKIDLTAFQHEANEHSSVYMKSIEFLEKDENIYDFGEKMHFKMNVECKKPVKDVAMRITVLSTDDTGVAMSTTSPNVFGVKAGEEEQAFELELTNLAPGRYNMTLSLYGVDDSGNNINLDVVRKATAFEIRATDNMLNKMKWESRWWGYLVLPEIKNINL